jgi:HAD superfamily hydrolase (TIGR01509 family)
MDEARAAGLKVAVCSAATKSAAVTTVSSLLGKQRWDQLDCFLAGNDVAKLKPDPLIYLTACERLGLNPAECIVIEVRPSRIF